MIYQSLVILATLAFLYTVISGWIERTPIHGALVYTLFGLLLGPAFLGWLDVEVEAEGLRLIAEITLGVVLFSDAAGVDFRVLNRNLQLPGRLLLIGLPLIILLGYLSGTVLFNTLTWVELAILATMLAPTDAALGKAVITDSQVSAPIRQGLNVESGLNDGICVPILFTFLAIAAAGQAEDGLLLRLLAEQIGIGAACGLVLAGCGAYLFRVASAHTWVSGSWRHIPVVSLALICFAGAQLAGGSGFIAAFCGGMLFGFLVGDERRELLESSEATGETLSMVTWVIFGAAVVGPALGAFTWQVLVYALLSLTLVRMLPVFICLSGTTFGTSDKLFMGWFGPRGLASIVFGVIVMDDQLPGGDIISMTMICTVLLSVILHGISANPLVGVLKRHSTQ